MTGYSEITLTMPLTIVAAKLIAAESRCIRLVPANVTHTAIHASEADFKLSLVLIEASAEAVVEVGQ